LAIGQGDPLPLGPPKEPPLGLAEHAGLGVRTQRREPLNPSRERLEPAFQVESERPETRRAVDGEIQNCLSDGAFVSTFLPELPYFGQNRWTDHRFARRQATHSQRFDSLADLKRSIRASLCDFQTMRGGDSGGFPSATPAPQIRQSAGS
jgi:hypothetical protein